MTSLLDRIFGPTPATKAASGPGVYALMNDRPLTSLGLSDQKRMAAYLKAYKVGWFYKAESKISGDIATMKRVVSHEDDAGDNEATRVEPDLFTPWERLDSIGQFLRLMERPNPHQTGRQLFQKTQIRIDMAGCGFWYLEGVGESFIPPTAIYGISPSRMWPSFDSKGVLIGWVMDRDSPGGGVPFFAGEILQFTTGSADDSPFGVGVVEGVYGEVPITEMMSRHVADVLSTGGRLAGMLWPKERVLDQTEFDDAQKAWRNVASDPNAARRMLIFPEPMEYAQGASTPAEIGIPELAALNRDNILTAFPVSPYMLGVPMSGGLSATGETRRQERMSYYEGTLHPRVELLEETIQIGLLARYEALLGTTYDFDIEEPNLDDASTLLEKAGAMKALVSLGFDDKEAVSAVGLDHIRYVGPPAPPPVPDPNALQAGVTDLSSGDPTSISQPLTKTARVARARDEALDPAIAKARERLTAFFASQRDRTINRLREHPALLSKSVKVRQSINDSWWDAEHEDDLLRQTMKGIYLDVGHKGLQAVADSLGRFIFPHATKAIVDDLLSYGGSRIKAVNERTLQAIVGELAEGTRRAYSLTQLIEGVPSEGFKGVLGVSLDNGTPVFGDLRAETIARTETMLSYNRATVTGYGEFGVTHLLAYDGDGDLECAERDGREFTIEEAEGIEDHPNGTLVWSPVVDKAEKPDHLVLLAEAIKTIGAPQPVSVTVQNGDIRQFREVVDRDPLTGKVTGSHKEPLDD